MRVCEFLLNVLLIRNLLKNLKVRSKNKLKIKMFLEMAVSPKKLIYESKKYWKLYLDSSCVVHHLYVVTAVGV